MAHTHDVFDMENHFEINGSSRFIKETSETKLVVVQGDHKSEVLTFKMPRYIDGHDMTLCNKIRIHYINLDTKTNNKSADVYEVTDLTLCEECEDVLTFTWTIEAPATKYSGTLSFLVKFECTEGENVLYQWNTAKYVSVNVLAGIDNSEEFVEKYSNVLEEWYNELTKGADSIEELNQQAIAEIELAKEDAKEDIQGKANSTMAAMEKFSNETYETYAVALEGKAKDALKSIPEDYAKIDADVKDIKNVIGSNASEKEETHFQTVVIRGRWYGSANPSISLARVRSERIERTDAMKGIVFGNGIVSQNVWISDDGVTIVDSGLFAGETYLDISSISAKYLYIDAKKTDNTNFTEEDDVSEAIGIVVTVPIEVPREIGKEVGNLNDLNTSDKSSVVRAINEVRDFAKKENTDVVKDAIGYVNVGETSSALLAYPRKSYYGNPSPKIFSKRAVAEVYKKSVNDYKIVVTEGYCIVGVWTSVDNTNLDEVYVMYGMIVSEIYIDQVPEGSRLYIDIAKIDATEFNEDDDLTGVISIISFETELRTVDCVSTPADIMARVLVNNRSTSKNLKIKLLGDSITHGVGSDDFEFGTETVDIMRNGVQQTYYRNIGGDSWASKFASYMSSKYDATVINNGVSGIKSTEIINSWDLLIDGDEELIICMIGTNDRLEYNDTKLTDTFYRRMQTIVKLANFANIPIILMSVIPVSVRFETHTSDGVEHNFTMHAEDINNIIHQVAYNNHLGYVPMFDGVLEYCDYTNTSIDSLLADQLHPNNDGHNLMYKILMRSLGLGRKIDGATW